MNTILSNGLVIGAIYGLVALGITLVYKKSRVLNFAHPEIGMFGGFIFFALNAQQHLPYVVAALAGITVSALLSCLTYLILIKRRNDPLSMLIGTLAIGGILLFTANEIWGSEPYFVPPPLAGVTVNLFGLPFIGPRLLVLAAGLLLTITFFILARRAKVAVLFRASATDPYAATLMGVDVVRLDIVTWTLAGGLAGLAAVLVAPLIGFDISFMTLLALRAFAAALLAGLTNIAGSLAAGLGIGMAESSLSRFSTQPGLFDAVLVGLIVIFLLIPRGGERARGTA